jgi:uncharacterized protein YfeS
MKHRKRFANPERRDRILNEFNRDNMDDVGPVGGESGMKVLSEMNSLADDHDEFLKSLAPR